MHICEYILKSARPKKSIIVLSGQCNSFNTFFKKSDDISLDNPKSGDVLSHVLNSPLFLEPSALWVNIPFEVGPLRKLLTGDLKQPVVYNTPCDLELPELSPEWKLLVQVVDKSFLKPGSKLHKEFLLWLLQDEMYLKETEGKIIIEALSEYFDPEDFFRSYDRMTQIIYGLPLSITSEGLNKFLATYSKQQLGQLLNPPKTPLVTDVLDAFFSHSKNVYPALDAFFKQGGHPLTLLKAMQSQCKTYLNSAWACSSSKGSNQDAASVAQGQKVRFSDFKKYQSSVMKVFSVSLLWKLLKDTTVIQSKYQSGLSTHLLLYSLVTTYVGHGF